jgi:5'-3' exonuclease
VRCAFANDKLTSSDGTSTGAQFGVLQSLNTLKRRFPEHQMLLVWDSKSKRRMAESSEGVTLKIIPEPYKENRRKDELPKPLKDFYDNQEFLQKGIGTLGIPQIKLDGYEADDVIASYANALKQEHEVFIVTSDKDYYQILDKNVVIFDGMKLQTITIDQFRAENGIEPSQWIDVGALMGDDGDNIFGIPSWGIKTALKEIIKFGSWQKVIEAYESQYASLRKQYPDLKDMVADFGEMPKLEFDVLAKAESDKKKLLYPEIHFDMPWTGVLKAFHEEKVKIPKSTMMALLFQDRVKLAYSLKKMDDNIQDLPAIENGEFNEENLTQFLDYYDIGSLSDTYLLFGGKVVEAEPQLSEQGLLDI